MGRKSAHTGESPKDRSINIMDKFISKNMNKEKHLVRKPGIRKDPDLPIHMWPLKDQIEYWENRTDADRFDDAFPVYSFWIAEVQKQGGIAAFIDAEHAFDQFYAQKLGVDVANLLISQPDNGEQALEIADNLIRSGAIDLIVIDSVAALTPKAEIEGEMGDSQMGLQARLMSKALRKLTGSINKAGCCCIFINQLRDKIGVMFGNPETTTGGNALKFYSSIRIDIRRATQLTDF